MEMSGPAMEFYSTSPESKSHEEELLKVKKENEELKDGLNFIWKEKEELDRKLKEIQKLEIDLKAENSQLKENLKEQTAVVFDQEAKIFSLRSEFEMAQQFTGGAFNLKKNENGKLKFEIANLRTEIANLKAENCSLTSEMVTLKAENSSLISKNAILKSENSTWNSEEVCLKSESDSLKMGNDSSKSEIDNFKTINDNADECGSLKNDSSKVVSSKPKTSIRASEANATNEMKSDSSQSQKEMNRLNRELNESKCENELLMRDLEKRANVILEKNVEIANKANQIEDLQRTYQFLQNIFEITKEQQLESKETVKSLTLNVNLLEEEKTALRNENETLKTAIEEIKRELREAHSENQKKLAILMHDRDTIFENKIYLSMENDRLTMENTFMAEEIHGLQTKLKAKRFPEKFDLAKFETDLLAVVEEIEDKGPLQYFTLERRLECVEDQNDSLKNQLEKEKNKIIEIESLNKSMSKILEKPENGIENDTIKSKISRKSTEIENELLKKEIKTLYNSIKGQDLLYRNDSMAKEGALAFTMKDRSRLKDELKECKDKIDRLIKEKTKLKEIMEKEKLELKEQKLASEKQLLTEKRKMSEQSENKIATLQTEVKTLKIKIDKLEDQNGCLLEDKRYLDSEMSVLSYDNKGLRKAVDDYKSEKAKLLKEAEMYKSQIEMAKETHQQENRDIELKIEKKERELEERLNADQQKWKQRVGDQKKTWQNEKLLLIDDKREAEHRLQTTLSELEKLKQDLSFLETEKTLLQDKYDALQLEFEQTDLYKANKTIECLEKELSDKKFEIFKVKEAFSFQEEKHDEEIRALNVKIDDGEKELTKLKRKGKKLLDSLQADKLKLEKEKVEISKDKEILENRIEFELNTLKQEIASKDEQLRNEKAINDSFKEKFQESLNENLKLKTIVQVPNSQIETFMDTSDKDELIAKLTKSVDDLKDEVATWTIVVNAKEDEVKQLNEESSNKESVIQSITRDVEGLQLRNSALYSELDKHKNYLREWMDTLTSSAEDRGQYGGYFRDTRGEKVHKLMRKKFENLEKTIISLGKFEKYASSDCYSVIREFMEAELNCSICTSLMESAVTLNCSHSFCKNCLDKWKESKHDCPMCRTTIKYQARTTVIENVVEKFMEFFPKEEVVDASSVSTAASASGSSSTSSYPLDNNQFPTLTRGSDQPSITRRYFNATRSWNML